MQVSICKYFYVTLVYLVMAVFFFFIIISHYYFYQHKHNSIQQ